MPVNERRQKRWAKDWLNAGKVTNNSEKKKQQFSASSTQSNVFYNMK